MGRIARLLVMVLMSGVTVTSLSFGYLSSATSNQTRQPNALESLQNIFRPRRRQSGTRGPVCLITPGLRPEWTSLSETPFVLTDRPLFVWQKPVTRVEVRLAKTNAVVWHQALLPQSQRILYQGTPLQPGQTYQVIAFGQGNAPLNVGEDAQFTLVDSRQRDEIIKELAETEAQLNPPNRSTEAIAIAKAIELSNHSLLSDAYQLLDALPQRSPELNTFLTQLSAKVCGN